MLLGPRLHIIEPAVLIEMAQRLVEHASWVILLSGVLTGWLMGLLSWLVSAAGDAISPVVFVGLIASAIGLTHLHHSISESAEVLMDLWTSNEVQWGNGLRFLVWTTLGNMLGGVIFAALIRFSVVLGGNQEEPSKGR